MKFKLKLIFISILITLKLVFIVYPAIIITFVILDPELRTTGESQLVPMWFKTSTSKYQSWSENYLSTQYALKQNPHDVAATEWPMFGSVLFLLTAQTLHEQGKITATEGNIRLAVNNAVDIISSPETATWVKKKWRKSYLKTGKSYLEKENVFYRMLLIMGLSSYESITGDTKHHALLMNQSKTLFQELSNAKYHLADDYPDQCYPADVLWAVAAIIHTDKLDKHSIDIEAFTYSFLNVLKTSVASETQLPAFQVNSKTGRIIQNARGSSTSGILQFAPMLDIDTATHWYENYEKYFLKQTPWILGFREFQTDEPSFIDYDTGLIINEFGSVASMFAIGASKGVGRLDHTIPLTIEAVAYLWPTPFGFLVPSVTGKFIVDSWSLGDVALLFSMTRPIYTNNITTFQDSLPMGIFLTLLVFVTIGILSIWLEIRWIKRTILSYKDAL